MSIPLAALLLRPDVIMAVSTAVEVIVRDLLRKVGNMTEEELDIFVAEQEARGVGHEEWLEAHQPPKEEL